MSSRPIPQFRPRLELRGRRVRYILFLGSDKQEVARMTSGVASQLVQDRYVTSPKSQAEPGEDVT